MFQRCFSHGINECLFFVFFKYFLIRLVVCLMSKKVFYFPTRFPSIFLLVHNITALKVLIEAYLHTNFNFKWISNFYITVKDPFKLKL